MQKWKPHRVGKVFDRDVETLYLQQVTGEEVSRYAWSLHPVLNQLLHYLFRDPTNSVLAINPSKIKSHSMEYSWRKMSLTCPPTTHVYVHKVPNKLHKKGLSTWNAYYGPQQDDKPLLLCDKKREVHKLSNPTGVTVTDFLELVEKLLSTGKANTFCLSSLGYVYDR
jgi:hypothetical protein